MSEGVITTIIVAIVAPILTLAIQQFFARRKNKIDYGDDLLETMNKTAASLKQARADLNALEQEMRQADNEHRDEIDAMTKQWNERQERMKKRIRDLEGVIVKYDISFTLQTHPQVQINDLKVIGKEDVMASQKMKAVRQEAKEVGGQ